MGVRPDGILLSEPDAFAMDRHATVSRFPDGMPASRRFEPSGTEFRGTVPGMRNTRACCAAGGPVPSETRPPQTCDYADEQDNVSGTEAR